MTLTESAAPTAVMAMRDVTIRFDRTGQDPLSIVEGYSLALGPGRMHCLAGRSGSGKTSILRVAAGLVSPTLGTVEWTGETITGEPDDTITRRRRDTVGYLDQGGVLVPGLTAFENVLLPAVPGRGVRKLARRATDLLRQLGVDGRANSYPDKLSGGERQRVALARALLLEPKIVMVDEPTASLDRVSADAVIALLRALTDTGVAVLVAAHDPHLIEASDTRTTLA